MTYRRYVDGPFGQLHLREAGVQGSDRTSLVCLHMSPMSSRTYDQFLDCWAAGGGHAVAFDTPGFGMSDAPADVPTIADYARAIRTGVEALGLVQPVDLLGYHTGSLIACELAASAPQMVRRLVLIAAPIFTPEERAELSELYGPELPAADGSHLVRRWQSFAHHFRAGGSSLEQIADAFPERLLGRANSWWGHHAAFGFAENLRLPEISQPVLVINPGDDLSEQTRRAAPLLVNGRIVEQPHWGHGFLDRNTEEAVKLVDDFLR
jgi:pimeloyl-ACP methyl ester carboxylesterase